MFDKLVVVSATRLNVPPVAKVQPTDLVVKLPNTAILDGSGELLPSTVWLRGFPFSPRGFPFSPQASHFQLWFFCTSEISRTMILLVLGTIFKNVENKFATLPEMQT